MTRTHLLGSAEGRAGRLSLALSAIWLVFLVPGFVRNAPRAEDPQVALGLVATVVFAGVYLAAFECVRRRREALAGDPPIPLAAAFVGSLVGLSAIMTLTLGTPGIGATIYVAVTAAMLLPAVGAGFVVVGLVLSVEALSHALDRFPDDHIISLILFAAASATWGVKQILYRNIELVSSGAEHARELVDRERDRVARDVHDLLGHSLTVIAVKSELANRLCHVDPERAAREVADIERLAREALADVRIAVQGVRTPTLPGEVARARAALAAADIDASLPTSVDDVAGPLRELFAWTIREGVTNVVRHSRAGACVVEVSATRVAVVDDGIGPPRGAAPGNGLSGLVQRAAGAGARVTAGARPGGGYRLELRAPR